MFINNIDSEYGHIKDRIIIIKDFIIIKASNWIKTMEISILTIE